MYSAQQPSFLHISACHGMCVCLCVFTLLYIAKCAWLGDDRVSAPVCEPGCYAQLRL